MFSRRELGRGRSLWDLGRGNPARDFMRDQSGFPDENASIYGASSENDFVRSIGGNRKRKRSDLRQDPARSGDDDEAIFIDDHEYSMHPDYGSNVASSANEEDEGYASGSNDATPSALPRKKLKKAKPHKKPKGKIEKNTAEQIERLEQMLQDLRDRRNQLDQYTQDISKVTDDDITVEFSNGDLFMIKREAYIDNMGKHIIKIETTQKIGSDINGPFLRHIRTYTGAETSIANMCYSKLATYIHGNNPGLQPLKVAEEFAPQFNEILNMPDSTDKDRKMNDLLNELERKTEERRKKVEESLKTYLNKYAHKSMDVTLLQELQEAEGKALAARERDSKIAGSEKKLQEHPEELQKITAEINGQIREIKQIISSSSTAPGERHALATPTGTDDTSSPESSPFSLANFDKKIEAYMMKNDSREYPTFNIYKDIMSLAANESKYPEGMAEEDKLKIHKALLDIGEKLVERELKLNLPLELQERRIRYKIGHYGKLLVAKSQLLDHLDKIAKAEREHAEAVHQQGNLIEQVKKFYQGSREADLAPAFAGSSSDAFESTQAQQQTETDPTRLDQHLPNLVNRYPQIQDVSKANNLQEALQRLEQANLRAAETKGKCEELKTLKEKIEKLIEYEKGMDDSDDSLDLKKVEVIKKADDAAIQHARNLELEMIKYFYSRKLKDQDRFNKEEEAILDNLYKLFRMELGNKIIQKRIATMYWLSLFGAGDQAALNALGRESTAEFNYIMSLFR